MSADGRAAAGSASASSNRDARSARPRVQQLRPTNKDAPVQPAQRPTVGVAVPDGGQGGEGAAGAPQRQGAGAPRVVPRIITGQGAGSTIVVNSCQKGNPVLKNIANVAWEYGDIVADYQVGLSAGVLYLSLRYHQIQPDYIHSRIKKMAGMYTVRLLMVLCDTDQPEKHIKELTKVGLVNHLTVMVAWSVEEVAAYLERYKLYEHKSVDLIRARVNDDYLSHLNNALTSIRGGVNKTDVMTLATNLGSFKNIADASADQLAQCPGFGEIKIRRLREIFRQPFRVGETRTGRERRAERERLYGSDPAAATDEGEAATTSAPALSSLRRPVLPSLDATDEELDQLQARSSESRPANNEASQTSHADLDAEDEIRDADEFDDDDDILAGLTEEEQLQLAMEMSISGGGT